MLKKFFIKYWQKWLAKKSRDRSISQPTEAELKSWACSKWVEYQAWLFHYSFLTLQDWQQLRDNALSWQHRPLLSVVTPVFNTHPDHLRECIYSVQTQTYPDWEMCLVDDGSDNSATVECLQTLVLEDHRLRLRHFPDNQGISHATNQTLAMACGEYIVFLDHDDRLAPDALYYVADMLRNYPDTDIIYSDRDLLSENGSRFMHLFKPDWSPETLLSGNYLFHLVVYRRELLEQLGGVRVGLDGSQDYDLILRAAEKEPKVRHISKVLYHWRQHKQSVASAQNVKEYAYTAGVQALRETLKRRGLPANISENNNLWRGHYRIHIEPPPPSSYKKLHLNTLQDYALQVNQAFERDTDSDYLVILGPGVQAASDDALTELIAWLQIAAVGMVTGKVLDTQGNLLHAGLVQRPNGVPLAVYAGFPENTPGYMAVTAIVRNLSTPHPACCVLKRTLWQDLGGLNIDYIGPHALLDFALRTLTNNKRIVYNPFARFIATEWQREETWPLVDSQRFSKQWALWLKQGDPYYNSYLSLEAADMGLNLRRICGKL
jgi:glycosyltransferase involved in cell wall biosynthesis